MKYEITISGFESGLTEQSVEYMFVDTMNLKDRGIDVEVTRLSEE